IIISYELYMRDISDSRVNGYLPQKRIFYSTGWLNPQPIVESENENALLPPTTTATIMNLEPNTDYEFCIIATNMAGSTSSEWVTITTEESEPAFMLPPTILPISSNSLNVTWERPSKRHARGSITGYMINAEAEDSDPTRRPEVLYVAEDHELFYIATGLKPYRVYSFTITVCNKIGCLTSTPGAGKTLAAAPGKLKAPLVHGINSTSMMILWDPPVYLNGPSPTYQLERIEPALTISSTTNYIKGTRFPGSGYLKFKSSILPVNSYFTGIKIQFRTKEPEGLILFAASAELQEEFIALQIKNGRPYFLFDPQGLAVVVIPTNDGGKLYNDNHWHQITALRDQARGTIIVDGQYRGSSSSTKGSAIIGEMTGMFIGGLPEDLYIKRNETGDAQISRKNFVGCLGEVHIQRSNNPQEIWELLDWNKAEERLNVYDRWEGCPEMTEEGAHFLGFGFLELNPSVFLGGPDLELSFMFKTDQMKGLLLFIYNIDGPDYFIVQLNNGIIYSQINTRLTIMPLNLWAGLSYCDGRWNKIYIKKQHDLFFIQFNNLVEKVGEQGKIPSEIQLNSAVFVGGVPEHIQNTFPHLDLQPGFGGCIKNMQFTPGDFINFATTAHGSERVNLDGCLSTDSSVNCRGNDSVIVYTGENETMYEEGLDPFTEYLYRVIASNEVGSETSDWSRGRTRDAVMHHLPIPLSVLNITGHSVDLSWGRPTRVRGIIDRYVLTAYPWEHPTTFVLRAEFPYTSKVSGTLEGLLPFTNYAVTLSLCTPAGCSDIPHFLNISTLEEVPGEVQAPTAESFPYSLNLHWSKPRKPNGIITKYILYMDGTQIYRGNGTEMNVTSLAAFTPFHFFLTACTSIGCATSPKVTIFTAQLPPDYVLPPVLTVLDATSIFVQWKEPKSANGILERYILQITSNPKNKSCWHIIYNSTELFLDFTIRNLIPATKYHIKLTACSAGGCTASNISSAMTEESTPDGVRTPTIQSYTPDSFNISWAKPLHPNGIITNCKLYMNGILVQDSLAHSHFVDGLSSWSKHSFQLEVCTKKGCKSSKKVEAYTQESTPEGNVLLHVISGGPRSVQVKWQGPEKPNGQMTYAVTFSGVFNENEDNKVLTFLNGQRILYQSPESNKWVTVNGLSPYSNYSIYVNASNTQGFILSDHVLVATPPAAPDGVLPPRLSSATSTSLQVVWSTPVRCNAPGLPNYQLQMRSHPLNEITELYSGPLMIYFINNLQPFTSYDLRIIASNRYGETYSNWTSIYTKEDKPGIIDPPVLTNVKSRSLLITWQHPIQPNGLITHYNIYQNGQQQANLPGNSSSYAIFNLDPHTKYQFQVEGCTAQGCSLSLKSLNVLTHPDAPSDIPAPHLHSDTPTSIVIQWQPPLHPNGIVDNFTIERRVKGTEHIYQIATVQGNHQMQYLDKTSDLSPWTKYEYRIKAATINGGVNISTWSEVKTMPSRPAGMQAPEVTVLGPYTAKVSWKMPLLPNGDILNYEIRMPQPKIVINNTLLLSHTVANLIPYTNYSVTIVACSGEGQYFGGCSESLPTYVTTHPDVPQEISPLSVIPISEMFVAVSWHPPSRPNGPSLRYELLRRKILQPLALNPPEDLNLWQNIYSGTQWFYEDKGLSRYTTYEYQLIVHNEVGYTTSTLADVRTMAGPPVHVNKVTASAINHTSIKVEWSKPTLQELQGDVELYTLVLKSSESNKSLTFQTDVNNTVIVGLHPNTKYQLYLRVFNGAHSINSDPVYVKTLDGEPEGIFPPEVTVINSTAVRVVWTPPSNPNGAVTEYSIYVNKQIYKTEMSSPAPFIIGDLLPFKVYNIQMEVCTVYACVKSNITQVATVEGIPGRMPLPNAVLISSRSVHIDWAPPTEQNGIILGFQLRRKTLYPCSSHEYLQNMKIISCSYLKCRKNEDICGGRCYKPNNQECCSEVLYSRLTGYECFGGSYMLSSPYSSLIRCEGQEYVARPEHRCCGGYYTRVQSGEVCCFDIQQNRVAVGDGDSCCNGIPYSSSSEGQVCCGGTLKDSFNQHCCGGTMMGPNFICCGDKDKGSIYQPFSGMICCGTEYINMSESICCLGSIGKFKVHLKPHNQAKLKCCDTELISEEEECCDGLGYDPTLYVCSNRLPERSNVKEEKCHSRTLCPIAMVFTAFCGHCTFNLTTDTCFLQKNDHVGFTEKVNGICATEEEIVYSGDPNTYRFTDSTVDPFTSYEYRVFTWNRVGHSFTNVSHVTTKQDKPQGVRSPKWVTVENLDNVISLTWKEPYKSNGIVHYIILRNGIERYKGTELRYLDRGISPLKEYTYQLKACTMAGCSISTEVLAATKLGVPENVPPLMVTPVNSTALQINWFDPEKANGIIKEYRVDLMGQGVIYANSGEWKQYTVTGLKPFTNYTFWLTACTSAGCNSSEPSSSQTLQDAPRGVWLNPFHVTINESVLELYWSEPEMPNGIVSQYRLLRNGEVISLRSREYLNFTDVGLQPDSRYFYQLEASTEAGSTTSEIYIVDTPWATPSGVPVPYNISVLGPFSIHVAWNVPEIRILHFICRRIADHSEKLLVHSWSHGILEYVDSSDGLLPFTFYDYRVTAQNIKGNVQSTWSTIQTLEAAPEDIKSPYVEATSAYSVFVAWNQPVSPNGKIKYYHVIYQEVHGEKSINVTAERRLTLPGTKYKTKVFGLLPFTTYEIHIEALNSAGKVSSPRVSVQTMEDSPSGLSNFTVDKRENGRALLLKWKHPESTNGKIQMYHVFCNGNLEYSGLSHQFLYQRLQPYTNYSVVLEACTAAGCTRTFPQLIQTEEALPTVQLAPLIHLISSTHVELTWSPPIQPNGKVKQYNILKRQIGISSENQEGIDERTVQTELNSEKEKFTYTDKGLHPWTHYEYKVRAWNSAGYTDSSWTMVRTSQAAPRGLSPPKLFYVENNPHHLEIQWVQPKEENGIVMSYRLQRNNETFPFTFDSKTFNYTDKGLMAFTEYSYSITACTLAGCTTSDPGHIKTLEAAPSFVHSPNLNSVSSSEINVTWSPPELQNGEISKYILQVDKEKYFVAKKLSTLVSNLQPFTWYNISLLACTNGGCSSSLPTIFRTMEAPPFGMKAPTLNITVSNSINIKWQIPDKPNGEIKHYELWRDGLLIYVGQDTKYHDFGLMPGKEYTYTVQAHNNQGSITTPPVTIKTHPSSPSALEPPIIEGKSSYEILVSWKPPLMPNGDIVNYTLFINCNNEMTTKEYNFNTSLSSERSHSFLVPGLKPHHQYEAKVKACTFLGCTTSDWTTGYTLEGPPESQTPPLIHLQANQQVPLVFWNSPSKPNGRVIYYELYRRKLTQYKDSSPGDLVYNGSSTSFKDLNALPYTEYEYQLWAVNSAGRTPSTWTYCQTGPATPEGIQAPTFDTVTSTQAVAKITPPTKPNGVVTLYRLFSVDTTGPEIVLSEGTSNVQTIYGLKPFTNYSIGLEVCTCLTCCGKGPTAQLMTPPAPPSDQLPPWITHMTSTSVSFQWKDPESQNGIIQGYEIYMQTPCPQPSRLVVCRPGLPQQKCSGTETVCNVTDLQPYTHYSAQVISYNTAGRAASEWITYTTHKEKPIYKEVVYVSSNITTVFLDWSHSFQLNGDLKEFVLTERGQRVYSGFDSSVYVQRTMDKTLFFQVTCTTDIGTVRTPIVKYNAATGLVPVQPFPSAKNETEARGNTFYTELWFIILMALLGLLVLAIILSLVLRKKLNKQPYPRERPALVPIQPRMSPSNGYAQHETYTGISELKISELEPHTIPSMPSVVRKTSQISQSFSQNSLYRSASQLIATRDKKPLADSALWDNVLQGHDSGMYADDEDLISTIKSFNTATKQHTAFTDTPL
ncbi:hypothetical protein GDO86_009076, partial [Hymenochirus boettgeri]